MNREGLWNGVALGLGLGLGLGRRFLLLKEEMPFFNCQLGFPLVLCTNQVL